MGTQTTADDLDLRIRARRHRERTRRAGLVRQILYSVLIAALIGGVFGITMAAFARP